MSVVSSVYHWNEKFSYDENRGLLEIGKAMRARDDEKCRHCPASLVCITDTIEGFHTCDHCGDVIANVRHDEDPFNNQDEVHLSKWCPRAKVTTSIACLNCCEKNDELPF